MRFNGQVQRNPERLPADFMRPLDAEDFADSRLQSATLNVGHGQHRKYLRLAFTEHGTILAANPLRRAGCAMDRPDPCALDRRRQCLSGAMHAM
jgi:hypothetical protein